jgi:flagellar hook-basal body complex protein FliE
MPPPSPTASFGKLLFQAFGRVNDMQLESINMAQRMITDPDSVNVHDITIAMAEANLSLSMTKAIADRAIRAYREIINLR